MGVVTRFAPSPTGLLQCGNYRTAVFAYLYAKRHGGKFILRIEDTDRERSKKEYEENILETLSWLSLVHDEFYRQSERHDVHARYLQKLVEEGHAYISDERNREGRERAEVIRFRNPNIMVKFVDDIRGEVEMNTEELGDFVIAKSMTEPLFHLAVVVDDFEMGVTHVIRGEDHISNTPRQILIQRAIGAPQPSYAHLPLVLAPDRSKLSKRKGAKPVSDYRAAGYLPQAILNYLALLGWNSGSEQELFSMQELISIFDMARVQKHGAIFDDEKLRWFNREYMLKLSDQDFEEKVEEYMPSAIRALPQWNTDRLSAALPTIRERISYFGQLTELADRGELQYYFARPDTYFALHWKNTDPHVTAEHLNFVIQTLENLSVWTQEAIHTPVFTYANEKGRGEVLWPFRYALSGQQKSPDPFTLSLILGKQETLFRLRAALATIG